MSDHEFQQGRTARAVHDAVVQYMDWHRANIIESRVPLQNITDTAIQVNLAMACENVGDDTSSWDIVRIGIETAIALLRQDAIRQENMMRQASDSGNDSAADLPLPLPLQTEAHPCLPPLPVETAASRWMLFPCAVCPVATAVHLCTHPGDMVSAADVNAIGYLHWSAAAMPPPADIHPVACAAYRKTAEMCVAAARWPHCVSQWTHADMCKSVELGPACGGTRDVVSCTPMCALALRAVENCYAPASLRLAKTVYIRSRIRDAKREEAIAMAFRGQCYGGTALGGVIGSDTCAPRSVNPARAGAPPPPAPAPDQSTAATGSGVDGENEDDDMSADEGENGHAAQQREKANRASNAKKARTRMQKEQEAQRVMSDAIARAAASLGISQQQQQQSHGPDAAVPPRDGDDDTLQDELADVLLDDGTGGVGDVDDAAEALDEPEDLDEDTPSQRCQMEECDGADAASAATTRTSATPARRGRSGKRSSGKRGGSATAKRGGGGDDDATTTTAAAAAAEDDDDDMDDDKMLKCVAAVVDRRPIGPAVMENDIGNPIYDRRMYELSTTRIPDPDVDPAGPPQHNAMPRDGAEPRTFAEMLAVCWPNTAHATGDALLDVMQTVWLNLQLSDATALSTSGPYAACYPCACAAARIAALDYVVHHCKLVRERTVATAAATADSGPRRSIVETAIEYRAEHAAVAAAVHAIATGTVHTLVAQSPPFRDFVCRIPEMSRAVNAEAAFALTTIRDGVTSVMQTSVHVPDAAPPVPRAIEPLTPVHAAAVQMVTSYIHSAVSHLDSQPDARFAAIPAAVHARIRAWANTVDRARHAHARTHWMDRVQTWSFADATGFHSAATMLKHAVSQNMHERAFEMAAACVYAGHEAAPADIAAQYAQCTTADAVDPRQVVYMGAPTAWPCDVHCTCALAADALAVRPIAVGIPVSVRDEACVVVLPARGSCTCCVCVKQRQQQQQQQSSSSPPHHRPITDAASHTGDPTDGLVFGSMIAMLGGTQRAIPRITACALLYPFAYAVLVAAPVLHAAAARDDRAVALDAALAVDVPGRRWDRAGAWCSVLRAAVAFLADTSMALAVMTGTLFLRSAAAPGFVGGHIPPYSADHGAADAAVARAQNGWERIGYSAHLRAAANSCTSLVRVLTLALSEDVVADVDDADDGGIEITDALVARAKEQRFLTLLRGIICASRPLRAWTIRADTIPASFVPPTGYIPDALRWVGGGASAGTATTTSGRPRAYIALGTRMDLAARTCANCALLDAIAATESPAAAQCALATLALRVYAEDALAPRTTPMPVATESIGAGHEVLPPWGLPAVAGDRQPVPRPAAYAEALDGAALPSQPQLAAGVCEALRDSSSLAARAADRMLALMHVAEVALRGRIPTRGRTDTAAAAAAAEGAEDGDNARPATHTELLAEITTSGRVPLAICACAARWGGWLSPRRILPVADNPYTLEYSRPMACAACGTFDEEANQQCRRVLHPYMPPGMEDDDDEGGNDDATATAAARPPLDLHIQDSLEQYGTWLCASRALLPKNSGVLSDLMHYRLGAPVMPAAQPGAAVIHTSANRTYYDGFIGEIIRDRTNALREHAPAHVASWEETLEEEDMPDWFNPDEIEEDAEQQYARVHEYLARQQQQQQQQQDRDDDDDSGDDGPLPPSGTGSGAITAGAPPDDDMEEGEVPY